jgi:hypothetical protein
MTQSLKIRQRRFEEQPIARPEAVRDLLDQHPAILEQRPLFPTQVVTAGQGSRALVSGANNRKIGRVITKGAFKGYALYVLTLAERTTCPSHCLQYKSCLAPGSRVLTADMNWVPIEELAVGTKIVGFDEEVVEGQRRRYRVGEVEATAPVIKKSFRVHTSRGAMTASDDHLWLAKNGRDGYKWMRTDELAPGDEIQFLAEPWTQDTSYGAGRIRGFVEGEGYVGNAKHSPQSNFVTAALGWSQKPGKLLSEINALVEDRGFRISSRQVVSGVNDSDIMHTHVLGGWREILRFIGVFRPSRLMDKVEGMIDGHSTDGRAHKPAVIQQIYPFGETEVFQIATTTKTLVAEGFLVHNCYGNAMPFAIRHRPGAELERQIETELQELMAEHPKGVMVRLHGLGDFYSVEYVNFWGRMLDRFERLACYGYTAHSRATPESEAIVLAVAKVMHTHPERMVVRLSGQPGTMGALVIDRKPDGPRVPEGLVCPAEREATACCATCGLCWSAEAVDQTIVFVRHGMGSRKSDALRDRTAQTDEKGIRPIRPIGELAKTALEPANQPPRMLWVRPESLLVDESYQRTLSRNSMGLIGRIVRGWDWSKFKAPIVCETDEGLFVIDGQHTAISAATHPQIEQIPVMVVEAATVTDRAKAFLGHNRDRIALTPGQIHRSAVEAGDPEAVEINRLCAEVGVEIVASPQANGRFEPGQTMALASIRALLRKQGPYLTKRVLSILSRAGMAPIRSEQIKALADAIDVDGRDEDAPWIEVLTSIDHEMYVEEARSNAASTGDALWRGLATVYMTAIAQRDLVVAETEADGVRDPAEVPV